MSKARNRFQGVRHRFRPGFVVWIMVMWCMLMGELSWANVFAGLGVGLLIVFALPLPAMPVGGVHISYGSLIKYMFIWAWELFFASLKVGWLAVRPQEAPRQAIVELPMRLENEFVLSVAVMLYNLQPGGTVSDIDIANRMLTIHILDAGSEAAIEREITAVAKLESAMIRIFERRHA
ncbi:MAG: Na+/H+ antiporter subunit E [Corynebacterium camporealensis]|uniref:Na+/H+ antiporter subunit E n=1 Tax=Corynebacterium camporealensis TaxID=161896 RepID=UPI002A91BC77|nr:Na+/H+ antiporter subunit E [Corynebacterium camporealensis]MDY5839807.1 Na+/H+ antiporter subunit E [Corynebacterium camporealensis]